LYEHESAVSVRLVLAGDQKEMSSRAGFYMQQLRVEIADMLGAKEDRVFAKFNSGPLIIADVTFALSAGGSDFVASAHYALELMKFVEAALTRGPSQEYLLLNKVTSATLLSGSHGSDNDSCIQTKLLHYNTKEARTQSTAVSSNFTVKMKTDWHDVDQPGAFGNEVLLEIARAAEKNPEFRARAEGISEKFFQVLSVHKERDALVVEMKFVNDPDQMYPSCEDLSGKILQELSSQINVGDAPPSMLNMGSKTKAVKSISASATRLLMPEIPIRLEIERAFGYNGYQSCGNMQLLTAYYYEELHKGNPDSMVQRDKVQLMYTAGNLVVMQDCSSGKKPVQHTPMGILLHLPTLAQNHLLLCGIPTLWLRLPDFPSMICRSIQQMVTTLVRHTWPARSRRCRPSEL
jgi:hypothetical protein